MLFDRNGRVFVARRSDLDEDAWQMPQGGIDEGEEPREAALRELEEEIGTRNVDILGESDRWLDYALPPEVAARKWGGKYRGQSQKWIAMRFRGRDDEIDLDAHHHSEFDAWRWVDIDALPGLIVAFKRPVYEALVDEFRRFAVG